jgi:hypothetical protein
MILESIVRELLYTLIGVFVVEEVDVVPEENMKKINEDCFQPPKTGKTCHFRRNASKT